MTGTAKLLIDSQCALGEGPFWHAGRQQLFWFDINNQTLFAANVDGEVQNRWHLDEIVAAAAIIDDATLVLASETGLKRLDLVTGEAVHLIDIERDVPTNRTNDSRVHPSGAATRNCFCGQLIRLCNGNRLFDDPEQGHPLPRLATMHLIDREKKRT